MSSICGYSRGRTPASTCGPSRWNSSARRPSSIAPTRTITRSVAASVEPRRRNLTFSHPSSARRRREIIPARAAALAQKSPEDPDIRVRSRSKNAADARPGAEVGGAISASGSLARSRGASSSSVPVAMYPQDHGVALAAARADRRHAEAAAPAAQLVDDRAEDACARGADRMAEGDRAAVDIDAVLLDAQLPDRLQRHGGEGLVDLPQVDVARLQAGLVQRLARRTGRGGRQPGEVVGELRVADDLGEHLLAIGG